MSSDDLSPPPPTLTTEQHHSQPSPTNNHLFHLLHSFLSHESDDQQNGSSSVYRVWCIYGLIALLLLWLLIICAWYRYKRTIGQLVIHNEGVGHKGSTDSPIEQLQFPLITSTSDTHLDTREGQNEYFPLSPETARIERATRRKKVT